MSRWLEITRGIGIGLVLALAPVQAYSDGVDIGILFENAVQAKGLDQALKTENEKVHILEQLSLTQNSGLFDDYGDTWVFRSELNTASLDLPKADPWLEADRDARKLPSVYFMCEGGGGSDHGLINELLSRKAQAYELSESQLRAAKFYLNTDPEILSQDEKDATTALISQVGSKTVCSIRFSQKSAEGSDVERWYEYQNFVRSVVQSFANVAESDLETAHPYVQLLQSGMSSVMLSEDLLAVDSVARKFFYEAGQSTSRSEEVIITDPYLITRFYVNASPCVDDSFEVCDYSIIYSATENIDLSPFVTWLKNKK